MSAAAEVPVVPLWATRKHGSAEAGAVLCARFAWWAAARCSPASFVLAGPSQAVEQSGVQCVAAVDHSVTADTPAAPFASVAVPAGHLLPAGTELWVGGPAVEVGREWARRQVGSVAAVVAHHRLGNSTQRSNAIVLQAGFVVESAVHRTSPLK